MSYSQRQLLINEMEPCLTIDFDECSKAWRENKNILKNGMFSYKKEKRNCCHSDCDGNKCRKKRKIDSDFCEKHY
jgi:hypothetical protein|uniref:Uncharacterized protein n=1 Tax=viral metagenome TaxID=1070528 RepID=A0A6C0CXD9_9ZZZZ